LDIEGAENSF